MCVCASPVTIIIIYIYGPCSRDAQVPYSVFSTCLRNKISVVIYTRVYTYETCNNIIPYHPCPIHTWLRYVISNRVGHNPVTRPLTMFFFLSLSKKIILLPIRLGTRNARAGIRFKLWNEILRCCVVLRNIIYYIIYIYICTSVCSAKTPRPRLSFAPRRSLLPILNGSITATGLLASNKLLLVIIIYYYY